VPPTYRHPGGRCGALTLPRPLTGDEAPALPLSNTSTDPGEPVALFACTEHWRSHAQVGTHHIARCFAARGWKVGFVSAPINVLHLAGRGHDAAARSASWRAGGTVDPDSGVWHFVPFAPLPWASVPLLRAETVVRAAWALCRPQLATVLRRAGFGRVHMGCTDHFVHEGLLTASSARLTVFRRADNLAAQPGAGRDFAQREISFARRADLTLCPTATGARYLQEQGARETMVMPNAIRLDRFFSDAPMPVEYAGQRRPIVVYVGAADHRLDVDLLARAVAETQDCHWVLIGPLQGRSAERLRRAGADVLGPRPHDRLAAYLQHAQVGVVPFSVTEHAALLGETSPLKVLEYAASGLPVVGTRGCQYPQDLPTPLVVCDGAEAFIAAVRSIALQPKPPRPRAEAFAAHAWQARLAPLFAWLADRGLASPC
jgi:glycosyltransferase involved in cell wall biosynthesis